MLKKKMLHTYYLLPFNKEDKFPASIVTKCNFQLKLRIKDILLGKNVHTSELWFR